MSRIADHPPLDTQEWLFRAAMIWRIAYGVMRLLTALYLFRHLGIPIGTVLEGLAGHWLPGGPDTLVRAALHDILPPEAFPVTWFILAYLAFWGAVDIFLSACLLMRMHWAFTVTLWMIALFVLYEIYRVFHTHSQLLMLMIVVDIFIFWIVRREERRVRRAGPFG